MSELVGGDPGEAERVTVLEMRTDNPELETLVGQLVTNALLTA